MTPLYMLTMNPHDPEEINSALLNVNVEVVFRVNDQGKMSLDYARKYNIRRLVEMINGLCNHRHAT